MRKGRYWLVFIFFIGAQFPVFGQSDTFARHGFASYREAADSIFVRILDKKYKGIRQFTVDEQTFVNETRKLDTVIPVQMIRGQYLSYWGKAERTFKKVHKKLRKRKVRVGKTVLDTVLLYRNTGNAEVQRAELYISQKKYKAY